MSDGEVCGFEMGDGRTCETSFGLCDCHQQCWSHSPCREQARSEAGAKGAERTNQKRREGQGLAPSELPPLVDHEAAETWLDTVGRAVGSGRISASEGNAIRGCVRDWVAAREAGEVSERLNRLEAALSEWRETGDASELLEVVEGGKP